MHLPGSAQAFDAIAVNSLHRLRCGRRTRGVKCGNPCQDWWAEASAEDRGQPLILPVMAVVQRGAETWQVRRPGGGDGGAMGAASEGWGGGGRVEENVRGAQACVQGCSSMRLAPICWSSWPSMDVMASRLEATLPGVTSTSTCAARTGPRIIALRVAVRPSAPYPSGGNISPAA